jgi:hypothetical protein
MICLKPNGRQRVSKKFQNNSFHLTDFQTGLSTLKKVAAK